MYFKLSLAGAPANLKFFMGFRSHSKQMPEESCLDHYHFLPNPFLTACPTSDAVQSRIMTSPWDNQSQRHFTICSIKINSSFVVFNIHLLQYTMVWHNGTFTDGAGLHVYCGVRNFCLYSFSLSNTHMHTRTHTHHVRAYEEIFNFTCCKAVNTGTVFITKTLMVIFYNFIDLQHVPLQVMLHAPVLLLRFYYCWCRYKQHQSIWDCEWWINFDNALIIHLLIWSLFFLAFAGNGQGKPLQTRHSVFSLTHCGPVTQICVFASQLWKTDDAKLPFNMCLVFTHLITQYMERT
jgi:hypothetical protein